MRAQLRQLLFDSVLFGYLLVLTLFAVIGPDEEQMLNLKLNFLITLFLAAVGLVLVFVLRSFKIKTLGEIIFEPSHQKHSTRAYPIYQTFWGWTLIISFLVTTYVGFRVTGFSFYEIFNQDGFAGAVRLLKGIVNPNFQVLPRAIVAIIETVYIAFIATVLAVPIAFVLSFLCAKNIVGKSHFGLLVYTLLRGLFNIMRSVEPFLWAIIFSIWVGIGPFAGMLALMVHTIASLAKQYSEQIECVEEGPIEGIMSTGANYIQILWFGVVPQITLPFVAFTIYRWDINVRMATVIGLVGGGGIGTLLIQYQGMAMWEEVGCIALVIVGVVWIMDTASSYVREALK